MSLRHYVLSFVENARRSPAQASDPAWLNSLELEAFRSLDGAFFALNAPVASLTWEVRTILPGTELTTDRIPFEFPHPVEVLGFRSVVLPIPGQAPGPIDPSSLTGLATDVVDCQLDIDKKEFATYAQGVSTPGGPNNSSFVTLSSLDIQAPRVQCLQLISARPVVGFTFQWSTGIATPFLDSLIKVSMFVRDITQGVGRNTKSTIGMGR